MMHTLISRRTILFVAVAIFTLLAAPASGAAPAADHNPTNQTNQTVNQTTPLEITGSYTGYLTPNDDNQVRWKATLTIPAGVSRVVFDYQEGLVEVTNTPASVSMQNGRLVWNGSSSTATILSITVKADSDASIGVRKVFTERSDRAYASSVNFHPLSARTTTGQPVTTNTTHAVNGEGYASRTFAVFGPYIEDTRRFNGTRVTIIYPAWMDGWSKARAIAKADNDTLAVPMREAYYGLRQVGRTTKIDSVVVFATGHTYISFADQSRRTPHVSITASGTEDLGDRIYSEVTHTAQDFTPTTTMDWLIEGMDRYYAAIFDQYRDLRFKDGRFSGAAAGEYNDVDLTKGDDARDADYERGIHILGHLQYRIHTRSNGTHSFLDVWKGLNAHEGPVSISDFEQIVSNRTGVRVGDWFRPALRGEGKIPSNPVNNTVYRPSPLPTNKSVDLDDDGLSLYQESHVGSTDFYPDPDGDGLSDSTELTTGTDPTELDTDGDGLGDFNELNEYGTNPTLADTDGGGLNDSEEVNTPFDDTKIGEQLTNATKADTDEDGLDDGTEVTGRTDPFNPDTDSDGLQDGPEIANQTKPTKVDTDGDGLRDGPEVNKYGTNPLLDDTDRDGLDDPEEVNKYGTDPTEKDTDGDGFSDYKEVTEYGTDPTEADSDGDGVPDDNEIELGLNATIPDTDDDGLDDRTELTRSTNATNRDTDNDGLEDGPEVDNNANPKVPDTDQDGLDDDAEVTNGTNATNADTDGDGLTDGGEIKKYGTGPTTRDTDGDGVGDGQEVEAGTTPTDPDSVPEQTQAGTATPASGGTETLGSDDTPEAFEDNQGDTYAPAPGFSVIAAILSIGLFLGGLRLRDGR